ncbi:hypothetical protein SAMN04488595_106100 [Ralstonia sp. 25mfcol4.1]|uniref:hypothetical protein n=1 Tax=Burkholderiaceae TaxID=119060 RepID=UPI000887C279|nr:hypothetical protein [Ralstonia sp. 25mfcol4.1]SDP24435.1 hypothetical protein SAMN04488595_106100 [Ralstonia sp. 25mfcol4.1]
MAAADDFRFTRTRTVALNWAALLRHAETRRYVADYEVGPVEAVEPVEPEDARQMIEQAGSFVAAIHAYPGHRIPAGG